MQVEMSDVGVEEVRKVLDPNMEVEFRMWMGWKTDIHVVLGLDGSGGWVDALGVLQEIVMLTEMTTKSAAKNASELKRSPDVNRAAAAT